MIRAYKDLSPRDKLRVTKPLIGQGFAKAGDIVTVVRVPKVNGHIQREPNSVVVENAAGEQMFLMGCKERKFVEMAESAS